jgi:hypothetical protein
MVSKANANSALPAQVPQSLKGANSALPRLFPSSMRKGWRGGARRDGKAVTLESERCAISLIDRDQERCPRHPLTGGNPLEIGSGSGEEDSHEEAEAECAPTIAECRPASPQSNDHPARRLAQEENRRPKGLPGKAGTGCPPATFPWIRPRPELDY